MNPVKNRMDSNPLARLSSILNLPSLYLRRIQTKTTHTAVITAARITAACPGITISLCATLAPVIPGSLSPPSCTPLPPNTLLFTSPLYTAVQSATIRLPSAFTSLYHTPSFS